MNFWQCLLVSKDKDKGQVSSEETQRIINLCLETSCWWIWTGDGREKMFARISKGDIVLLTSDAKYHSYGKVIDIINKETADENTKNKYDKVEGPLFVVVEKWNTCDKFIASNGVSNYVEGGQYDSVKRFTTEKKETQEWIMNKLIQICPDSELLKEIEYEFMKCVAN